MIASVRGSWLTWIFTWLRHGRNQPECSQNHTRGLGNDDGTLIWFYHSLWAVTSTYPLVQEICGVELDINAFACAKVPSQYLFCKPNILAYNSARIPLQLITLAPSSVYYIYCATFLKSIINWNWNWTETLGNDFSLEVCGYQIRDYELNILEYRYLYCNVYRDHKTMKKKNWAVRTSTLGHSCSISAW